ncbi:MAG TPA: FAD-binding protein [Gammaproteobacteria bacterium]
MSTAVARKRAGTFASAGPAAVVHPTTPSEIAQVLRDLKRYPSPVRPVGSRSSTTRCVTANGGTVMDLSDMNRVLRIDADTVTVQPGITLSDLAEILSEEGKELIGGFDLANRSVGGAVCGAGLEASIAGGVGQFAAHAVQLKIVSPTGRKFVVNDRTKHLMALLRLSYGLLGVVYEITLRIRPVQGFAVQTARTGFKEFAKLGTRLAGAGSGVKLYLLPFRDHVYLELRRPAERTAPGRRFAWRLKDWAVYSALPGAARSIAFAVPVRQLRYPLIDGLSKAAQALTNNALVRTGSNAVEQSGRFQSLGGKQRFTYCTWAFPAEDFGSTALAYKLFCKEHYARTGFRCDMPTIGFRLNQDKSALLSPSFDRSMITLSPLSTQSDGWDDFVLDFAEFAAEHQGVPFFNQTRNATADVVNARYDRRLAFFNKVRTELDPMDRMLNQFFAAYLA